MLILLPLIGWLLGIALYLLMAWSLYVMASKRNIEYAWLAFIPFANYYILGKLVGDVFVGTYPVPYIEYVLPAGALLCAIIPIIRWLIAIVFAVLLFFTLLKLFKMYSPGNEILYAVLSLIPIVLPILLFIIKDNTPTTA
jgi:hypothetical protein